MSQNKKAYFQGGGGINEPTPGKTKYDQEPPVIIESRPMPFTYNTYHGPYFYIQEYNSVDDFLDKARKKNINMLTEGNKVTVRGRMSLLEFIKNGYFQGGGGVNEPEPKKKKYKSDPAIVVQPRFKEPFYRNYDLYNTPGEHSPGAGWHDMEKYKSVSEFLKAKRKKLKDKYKADDSWIMDDNSKTKKNPNIEARASIFQNLIKVAIDFPIDDQIETEFGGPMGEVPEDDNPVGQANLTGGYLDEYLPENDFEGKAPTELDFGRDYVDGDIMEKLFNKYLTPSETELFGLPDGIDPNSDLDAEKTMDVEQPFAGTSDIGTGMYEDKWNI